MNVYRRMTLAELIDTLEGLPAEAVVDGLDTDIDSYRGYYERNAVGAGPIINAHDLAQHYRAEIGKPIQGYKGGDYNVSADELVYRAGSGDTGPAIIGFHQRPDGTYEPVLLAEDWRF